MVTAIGLQLAEFLGFADPASWRAGCTGPSATVPNVDVPRS
jgi:hypothetical protein